MRARCRDLLVELVVARRRDLLVEPAAVLGHCPITIPSHRHIGWLCNVPFQLMLNIKNDRNVTCVTYITAGVCNDCFMRSLEIRNASNVFVLLLLAAHVCGCVCPLFGSS